MGFWFGDKDEMMTPSTLTGGQQRGLSDLLQQWGAMGGQGGNYSLSQDYLHRMLSGDQESYDRWAAPYKTQFEQQTVPMLAERFAGMGGGMGGGAISSSGFGQAVGGAGAQLSSNLAGLYAQIQQQAAQQAMNQYNTVGNLAMGTKAFDNIYRPGSTGAMGGILSGLASGAGMALTGGLSGGLAGGGLSALSSFFKGGAGGGNIGANLAQRYGNTGYAGPAY